ncbi:Hsp70 family protein [Mesorhizobium sp. M0317]|uniref:Hsp70 family protein n=1 Tax=Mesorhizobium sp. M0317 TaxID=2956935 RepID=UPI00333CF608
MSGQIFGIDFGTTNSLVTLIDEQGRPIPLVEIETNRPHPSVLWYRGSEIVVGRKARRHLDITSDGAPPGFVRSPKMALRQDSAIQVDGRIIDPSDAVSEVLKHLVADAAKPRDGRVGEHVARAVMTVPVNFGGPQRRALRRAAAKAGIGVVQFVHEPVAALYAYLRSQENVDREIARYEERTMLVFDWGGGTLDLTLCRIQGGMIRQIDSLGDNDVGGDRFDERLRNLVREKHAKSCKLPDVVALERPGMAARLLNQCENAKIDLSDPDKDRTDFIINGYLQTDDQSADLLEVVTREELDTITRDIVLQGLGSIDEILERSGLQARDVEFCLATGGMVNMPAIRNALAEKFPGRYRAPANGDRIISEGAAWIAADGLRLCLSKPIEILSADSTGRGTYQTLVSEGTVLPIENANHAVMNSRLYCVDPREGVACIEFAKPRRPGKPRPSDKRTTLQTLTVSVDPTARPLIERIICDLVIDHDYVATATLRSTARGDVRDVEFHDLDFALALPRHVSDPVKRKDGPIKKRPSQPVDGPFLRAAGSINLTQRPNVVFAPGADDRVDPFWRFVPGDIVGSYQSGYFDVRSTQATERQHEERDFYQPCASCRRLLTEIRAVGPVETCRGRRCGISLPPLAEPMIGPFPQSL